MSHNEVLAPGSRESEPPVVLGLRKSWRWIVSAWLVFHLAAIIIAPAAVGPSSEVVHAAWAFFAPLPGAPLPQPRLPLFRPRTGREHAPGLRGERPDGTGDPWSDSGPGRQSSAALPPLFHAHRTHAPMHPRSCRISGISRTQCRSARSTGPVASTSSSRPTSCRPGSESGTESSCPIRRVTRTSPLGDFHATIDRARLSTTWWTSGIRSPIPGTISGSRRPIPPCLDCCGS